MQHTKQCITRAHLCCYLLQCLDLRITKEQASLFLKIRRTSTNQARQDVSVWKASVLPATEIQKMLKSSRNTIPQYRSSGIREQTLVFLTRTKYKKAKELKQFDIRQRHDLTQVLETTLLSSAALNSSCPGRIARPSGCAFP